MSGAFAPKSRRARFELQLHIIDLNNVPLVSGTSFVKWHITHSTAAEHRGKTSKCLIREHRVNYDYRKNIPVRLTAGKDGMLQESRIELEVLQEYGTGGRGERICLGFVRANLAEYVEASDMSPTSPSSGGAGSDVELGIVRRYLMQDSKINSTLKLGIYMKHIEGTRDYYAPPLRTAPVFGGIAGIISSSEPVSTPHGISSQMSIESGGQDEGSAPMPSLSTTNKELGEMQDMYRRTLAAHWASLPGELKADECIEDIFAGGNGWGQVLHPGRGGHGERGEHTGGGHHRRLSSAVAFDGELRGESDSRSTKMPTAGHDLGHARHASKSHSRHGRQDRKTQVEVDESEARDDLRSWRVNMEPVA